jgi:hypothetical protein
MVCLGNGYRSRGKRKGRVVAGLGRRLGGRRGTASGVKIVNSKSIRMQSLRREECKNVQEARFAAEWECKVVNAVAGGAPSSDRKLTRLGMSWHCLVTATLNLISWVHRTF